MRFFHFSSLLILYLFALQPAQAHKMRPAIIDLHFDQDATVSISIQANAEALLSGIGPEHDNTDDAPEAEVYRELRELSPALLTQKFDAFQQAYAEGLDLQLDGKRVAWIFSSITIPEVGDTRVSRKSVIEYRAQVPDGARQAVWSYAARYGDAVVNISAAGEAGKVSHWLVKGQQSPVFELGRAITPRGWSEVAVDYTHLGNSDARESPRNRFSIQLQIEAFGIVVLEGVELLRQLRG